MQTHQKQGGAEKSQGGRSVPVLCPGLAPPLPQGPVLLWPLPHCLEGMSCPRACRGWHLADPHTGSCWHLFAIG